MTQPGLRVEREVSGDYERVFLSDPGATPFHHPDFLRASEAIFRGRLEIWWLGDRCACPVIVRKKGPYTSASSLGYGCYGGAVGERESFAAFLRLAREADFSRIEFVDFRCRLPSEGFRVVERTAHILPLPDDPEALLFSYSALRRRELRNDIAVERGAEPDEFYELHRQTFASLRMWVTPEEGISALSGSEIARFYAARASGRIAGVLLVLSYGQEAIWWISGRRPDVEGVMTHLLHTAISDAISEGKRYFNMGGTDAPGPARFKESMGARPYPYRSLVREKGVLGLVRRIRRG